MRIAWIALIIFTFALVMPLPAAAQVTALTGATIIDGNGGAPISDGVIVITDKKITAIGAKGKVLIPQNARQVDLTGKFITPGLMDANVHLIPWPSWEYIEFLARYENNFEGIIEEADQIALKHGFTTVFDSMGPAIPLMHVRDRIQQGETEGSRLFIAGDIVGFRAVFTTPEAIKSASRAFQERINALFEAGGGPELGWMSPNEVKAAMRKYVAQGVDFVKYGATGDGQPVNSSSGQSAVLRFSPDQQRAIVEAVHEAGKIVQTHQTSAEALRIVVEVGNDMAQHCASTGQSRIADSTIQMMLDKKFYCGTQWRPLSETELKQVRDQNFGTNYGLENQIRLIKAGVPELVSTDAGLIDPDVAKDRKFGTQIGEDEFVLMKSMADRGMTPMAIIQAATKNIAAAYHKLDQFGTLEPGKSADLIVVDANPLQNIENIRKISMVMKEGKTVDVAKLPRKPILTSPEAMNPGPVRIK
jgi:imidazolonepropionase-like amidohydrolase